MKKLLFILFTLWFTSSCIKEPDYQLPQEVQFLEGTWRFNKSYLTFYNFFGENEYQINNTEINDEYVIEISNNGKIQYFKNDIPVKTDYIEFKEIKFTIPIEQFGMISRYVFNQKYALNDLDFNVTITKDSIFDFNLPYHEGAHNFFDEYHLNLYTKEL